VVKPPHGKLFPAYLKLIFGIMSAFWWVLCSRIGSTRDERAKCNRMRFLFASRRSMPVPVARYARKTNQNPRATQISGAHQKQNAVFGLVS
jgi:hypothetical protein